MRHHWLRATASLVCAAGTVVAATPAFAQQDDRRDYEIAAQPLASALRAISLASGRSVVAPAELLDNLTAAPVRGRHSAAEAIDLALAGTGLRARGVGATFIIEKDPLAVASSPNSEIVVTGTRIRGKTPPGASVITITRGDIDRSGYSTTQQLIQALPQNFGGGPNEGTVGFSVRNNTNTNFGFGSSINLRGLGTTSTLTLIDGNRVALGGGSGTFVDLTLIPASFIERIEVLGDGASALYGSDAVAGVVNVRLRRDFKGAETRARYGLGRGYDELQLSQIAGIGWSSGRLALAYEYYDRGRIPAAGRAYATEDLRAFGGPDYRKTFANPGTIIAADGSVFGIPRGQDGRNLRPADLLRGQPNLGDGRTGTDVTPDLRRHAAAAAFQQDIGGRLVFRLSGFFADRRSDHRTFPDNYGNVVVPTTNPFYVDPLGTRQPITVNYAFTKDLGPETLLAHVRAWSGIAGLDGRFGQWSIGIAGTFGVQTEQERTVNIPNYFKLAAALADNNPATAYNVLGDGSFTPRATIDSIRGFYVQTGRSRIWTAGGKAEGPLFRLPAGDVRLALGGEFRREHYSFTNIDFEFSPDPVDAGNAGFPIGRSVVAGYAELLVPVIAPSQNVDLARELTLSLAGRVERYSDFGTTANPKIGVTWRPVEGVTLRGTYGTSFRAPSFVDIRSGRGTSLVIPLPLPDPGSPGGSTTGLALFGGSPGVGPEKARSFTLGLDLRPQAAPGLSLTLTYFNIAYRDRITSLGADYLSFLADRTRYGALITDAPSAALVAGYYADENFTNPFGIPASAIKVIIDGRTKNLARVNQTGLDFDLGYRFKIAGADAQLGASGAYLFAIRQRVTATAPVTNVVSAIGNPVDLRLRGRAVVTAGRWSGAAFVNFVNGYRNDAVTPAERVKSFTTLDAQLAYDVGTGSGPLRGLRLALNVSNLFDRDPPYVNNPTVFSAAGFDPENASAAGRMVSLQLTKSW